MSMSWRNVYYKALTHEKLETLKVCGFGRPESGEADGIGSSHMCR